MAGFRRFRVFVGIFIPFLAFFLMSHNTNAIEFVQTGNRSWSSGTAYTVNDYWTLTKQPDGGLARSGTFADTAVQYFHMCVSGNLYANSLLTFTSSGYFMDAYVNISLTSDTSALSLVNQSFGEYGKTSHVFWLESDQTNPCFDFRADSVKLGWAGGVEVSFDPLNYVELRDSLSEDDLQYIKTYLGYISSTNTNISNNMQNVINAINSVKSDSDRTADAIEEHNAQEQQSLDNISDQTTNDIDGATSQQTDNLIGVLSNFIAAFQNVNATNCNLTLDFPNFAGGTRIVNICSGKERAPRIIEIGSSLLLIGVFVPLAFIMIRMIYNEIRSWTNG